MRVALLSSIFSLRSQGDYNGERHQQKRLRGQMVPELMTYWKY